MLNSPDAAAADLPARGLDWLRGLPNPFTDLVRPQRSDERFSDLHVPALLRGPRELLLAVIDSYRIDVYRSASDLRDTRAVTILGARGAGKTHMLEALANRTDGRPQLIIRPTYLDTEAPFEEYLRDQLLGALLTEDPTYGSRPFLDLSVQLTRRLLRQALRSLGPTDRLFAAGPPAEERQALWWGGGHRWANRCLRLADDLADPAPLTELAARHDFAPERLVRLVVAHVHHHERGEEALSAVRRQLYEAMARIALTNDAEAISQFLEAELTPPGARPFFRTDVIRQQIHALVETCAMVRLPVVVALDNLEGALAPGGQFDPDAARALLDGLAQAVDATRGLLLLLFAESDLYREARKHGHQFALDRLDQGVHLTGRGPVDVIEMTPPPIAELRQLIAARVGRQLQGFPDADRLPAGFPFGPTFLADLAGRSGTGLRKVLVVLRDAYERAVFGRSPPPAPPLPVDWGPLLELAWTEKLAAADHKLQGPLTSHAAALHLALRRLLALTGLEAVNGWQAREIKSLTTTDGHPSYGHLTGIDWWPAGVDDPEAAIWVGVGFLLARGGGLPRDLKAKLSPLTNNDRSPDGLVVLWPKTADGPLVDVLPPTTRKVWNSGTRFLRGAALRPLPDDDLRKLLALPEWLDAVQGAVETPVPLERLQLFVWQRCQSILQALLPPLPERSPSDAN